MTGRPSGLPGRAAALAALALLAAGAAPPAAAAQATPAAAPAERPVATRADTAALRRTLESLAAAHRGVVGYAVHNLDTGERLERRGDETFPTASLIKVPILVALFGLIEEGEMSLDDPLTVLKTDQVGGTGVLRLFRPGTLITVGDAARLMIAVSDNTATNLLLDRVVIRRVWDKMEALGLPHTKVHSKSFKRNTSVAMDSSVKYGLGVTTSNEMARLFALLADGKAVSARADSTMLEILEDADDPHMLQRNVAARAAHKTGLTDQVRTECTLWRLPARVVACVLTKENEDWRYAVDNAAQLTMARMGEAIVGAWRPPAAGTRPAP